MAKLIKFNFADTTTRITSEISNFSENRKDSYKRAETRFLCMVNKIKEGMNKGGVYTSMSNNYLA